MGDKLEQMHNMCWFFATLQKFPPVVRRGQAVYYYTSGGFTRGLMKSDHAVS